MGVKKQINNTISTSKTAQTQLKTTLRNHIDLSAIADNKANIMLSVNAIVITIGLPLILDKLTDFPQLLIPIAILGLSSVVSMFYATLATRPIKMTGLTDINTLKDKKTNLFFFGNFYKMSALEYEKGLSTVIADQELLDNAITTDLFYLGKSLGRKYDLLRICYNAFIFGIICSMVSILILSLMTFVK